MFWTLLESVVFDHVLLPVDLDQHALHLVGDLLVTSLLVASSVAIHLVAADANLLDTQQIDKTGVLAGLALHLAGLVVALDNGRGEVTIARNHDKSDIRRGGTGNHVLDEIAVTWSIDAGAMPLVSVERNGHTTL